MSRAVAGSPYSATPGTMVAAWRDAPSESGRRMSGVDMTRFLSSGCAASLLSVMPDWVSRRRTICAFGGSAGWPARRGRQQAEGPGSLHGLVTGVRAELGVQVAHVRLDRVPGQDQLIGDLAGGQVGGPGAQHADFALAEGFARR